MLVTVPLADVRAEPNAQSALVFEAYKHVIPTNGRRQEPEDRDRQDRHGAMGHGLASLRDPLWARTLSVARVRLGGLSRAGRRGQALGRVGPIDARPNNGIAS